MAHSKGIFMKTKSYDIAQILGFLDTLLDTLNIHTCVKEIELIY